MYVILNPVAGFGKVQKLQEKIVALIKKVAPEADFVKTISPGDAVHLANVGVKKGHNQFICVGGDGTVHEIINGLGDANITLGIIPVGTKNHIAKSLNIPMRIEDAAELLIRPSVSKIDIGEIGQKRFIMTAGFGLEVEIASKALSRDNTIMKKAWSSLKPYFESLKPFQVKLYIDDQFIINMKLLSCSLVNLTSFHAKCVPSINFDPRDGKLHFIAFSPRGKENLMPRLLANNTFDIDDVRLTQFKAKKIHILYPEDIPLHADGEIIRQTTPIEIGICKHKQSIITGL